MANNTKKKRLKTGLDILLGSESNQASNNEGDLVLNITDIKPNKYQPRTYFDENAIKELADSIKEQGLLMPILVKQDKSERSNKKYRIIAGERRWRACKSLKMKKIKAILIKNTNEKLDALAAIIENVQREDLSV